MEEEYESGQKERAGIWKRRYEDRTSKQEFGPFGPTLMRRALAGCVERKSMLDPEPPSLCDMRSHILHESAVFHNTEWHLCKTCDAMRCAEFGRVCRSYSLRRFAWVKARSPATRYDQHTANALEGNEIGGMRRDHARHQPQANKVRLGLALARVGQSARSATATIPRGEGCVRLTVT